MGEKTTRFSDKDINNLNEKVIQSQFFTPDRVYIELGLLKDIPIGVMYADKIIQSDDEEGFKRVQEAVLEKLPGYQNRVYDTIDPFFSDIGYTDDIIEQILRNDSLHNYIFLMAPVSYFFNTLIKHTIRNQNNSKPANKFSKKSIGNKQYILEATPVTYRFNTYPLKLSIKVMEDMGKEFGESFGVNVEFMCKDPSTFDRSDWDTWLEQIECFYFDVLGNFTRSPFVIEKQSEGEFVGKFFFARKRFEKRVMKIMKCEDFEQQVQMASSHLDLFCEFNWLQNNQTRLSEEDEDVPVDIPSPGDGV